MNKILILLPLLISCGPIDKDPRPHHFWEPDLVPYRNAFLEDTIDYRTPIAHADLRVIKKVSTDYTEDGATFEPNMEGLCSDFQTEVRVARYHYVDYAWREIWITNETISDTQTRLLMYHELGHCLLNKVHGDGIMFYRMIPDDQFIEDHWINLVAHLMRDDIPLDPEVEQYYAELRAIGY